MTLHISLQSKKIVNLYVGMAADAQDHEADWLQPTTDTVTYSDGTSEEVYGFDVPVEALDTDFPAYCRRIFFLKWRNRMNCAITVMTQETG